tara:strand:+ start:311 stop:1156 length:846 start_codon:yes stop_codon:yes gene_type:complete
MSEACEPEDADDGVSDGDESGGEEEIELPPQHRASLDRLLDGVSELLLAKLEAATAGLVALQPLHPDVVVEIADALLSRITDNNWDMHIGGGWRSVPNQDLADAKVSLTLELNALVKSGAFAVQICSSMDTLLETWVQGRPWWDGGHQAFSDPAYVEDAQALHRDCVPSRETVRADLGRYLLQRTWQFGTERLVELMFSEEGDDDCMLTSPEESGEESEGEESEGDGSESVGESGEEAEESDEEEEDCGAAPCGVKRELEEEDEELSAEEIEALRSKARTL